MPAPSSAFLAQGTLLQFADSSPNQTISEVRSMRGPTLRRDTIDVTNHDSTSAYREFINGLKDAGSITFDINYLPTDGTHNAATGLLGEYDNGTTRAYALVFSDPSTTSWTFNGVVIGFEVAAAIDEVLISSIELKISGAPTLV